MNGQVSVEFEEKSVGVVDGCFGFGLGVFVFPTPNFFACSSLPCRMPQAIIDSQHNGQNTTLFQLSL